MKYYKMMLAMFNLTMYVDGGEGGGGGGGEGGEPTLLAGKYETQEDLIKGYTELNTAFSGKDEAHQVALDAMKSPETFTAGEDWGSDNAMNNRMMSVFQDVAKDHNMPQGMYESLVNGMTEMQGRVSEETLVETQKSIVNYDNRATAMIDTATRFLRPDQVQALDSTMQTKESFEVMELLFGQLRGSSLPTNVTPASGESEAEVRAAIKKLNPADTKERARLMAIINAKGNGEGSLV